MGRLKGKGSALEGDGLIVSASHSPYTLLLMLSHETKPSEEMEA